MNITVYCGANFGNDERYRHAAARLGKWIVDRGHSLVYGGGSTGLMGVVADTVLAGNAKAIGIMPSFLIERELAHKSLTEFIEVDNMSIRKKMMIERGDVFIALPGGPGTLEEITEVISWSRIGQNSKPCIFFNENDYFNSLRSMYKNMISEGFLAEDGINKILFTNDVSEIDRFIESYKAPEIRGYK